MARFTAPLRTEKRLYWEQTKILWLIPRRRRRHFWVVLDEFSLLDESGHAVYTVPPDFKTDFSSVPKPFRFLFPKDDVDSQAAVGHDWLYHANKPKSVIDNPWWKRKTRKECDAWFLVGMQVCGQTPARRRIKYRAVRLGGWYGWGKRDKPIITDDQEDSR